MTSNYQKQWNEYQEATRREVEEMDYQNHLEEQEREEAAAEREARVCEIVEEVREIINDRWPDEGADWYDDDGNLADEMRWRDADKRAMDAVYDEIDAMDDDVLYSREAAEIAYTAYAAEIY